ncbi:MAG TPA: hypothetical protein VMT10_02980 [Solirubrobacteraceae bacterium]|nr:hypothetical protein [Solirubrobacteraceae bacterium]
MSVVPPPLPPAQAAAPPGTLPCPRCGELLAPDQDWCLRCGDPARTVIAPTPHWKRPIGALIATAALALGVLAAAFVGITSHNQPPSRTLTTTITTQPGQPLPPGVTPAPTTTAATAPATQTATTLTTTTTSTTTTTLPQSAVTTK